MIAKTKDQYVAAWTKHVSELSSVFYEAGIPVAEWDQLQAPIRAIIRKAADKCFPDEE